MSKIKLLLFLITPFGLFSDNQSYTTYRSKGNFYTYWGYNRSFFSKSDIHFISDHYDFTLNDVTASDRPTSFSLDNYFNPKNISIPQYCFRFGYFITDRIQLSFGMDHMKYVVDQNQKVTIKGKIGAQNPAKFIGSYTNDTILIEKGFLEFEHTNGLNLVTVQADYAIPICHLLNNKMRLKWNVGIGGVWVGTKTDVKLFTEGIDNDHHLAGYSGTIQTGPRIEFWKCMFIDFQVKAGYMSLQDVFIENESAPKRANQNFSFWSYYGDIGIHIPIKKKFKN
jgi:hypothetical protein